MKPKKKKDERNNNKINIKQKLIAIEKIEKWNWSLEVKKKKKNIDGAQKYQIPLFPCKYFYFFFIHFGNIAVYNSNILNN